MFTCLVLVWVFLTLFFMETFSLFQSAYTSDLVSAKAPGAFGAKPHVLMNVSVCPRIFILKKSLILNDQS